MPVICDTSSVPAEDRAELWVTATSELFVPLECTPHDRASFAGLLQAGVVGPLALSRLEVSPHTVQRTAALAADTDGDRYKLSLLLAGQALVVQDGREAVLQPGDFALYDCSRPYTIEGAGGFRMLVCMLPRAVLGLVPARVGRMTATRIRGDGGIAWAVAPFLERLADLAVCDEVPGAHHRVVESVVDSWSRSAPARTTATAVVSSSRAELLLRPLRTRVPPQRPVLSPAQIAAAVHVSKRDPHRLFEAEGISVSRWIRQRRLEQCRRDLADPSRRDHTVTSIGVRWGLVDSAHFSRLFREAYGCTPTEYRREHLHRGDGAAAHALARNRVRAGANRRGPGGRMLHVSPNT